MSDSPLEKKLSDWFLEEYEKAKRKKKEQPNRRRQDVPPEVLKLREEIREQFQRLFEKAGDYKYDFDPIPKPKPRLEPKQEKIQEPAKDRKTVEEKEQSESRNLEQVEFIKGLLRNEYNKVVTEYNEIAKICLDKKLRKNYAPVSKLLDCRDVILDIRNGLANDSIPYKRAADMIDRLKRDINHIRTQLQNAGFM